MFFLFIRRIFRTEADFYMVYPIISALNSAVLCAATENSNGRNFSRQSPLSRTTVIRLLLGAEGGSLDKILHAAGLNVTASAVSQRRSQISPATFRGVFDYFNSACTDNDLCRGYRLLAVDGTTVNLPRNPNSPSFVQNEGIPKGVNQLHVTPLYDILARAFADVVIQPEPKKDEIGALLEMLHRRDFNQKTLIIADRGFESYNLIAHILEKPNVDFLIRVKQNYSAMREIAKLPMMEIDGNVNFTITTTQTKEDKEKKYVLLQMSKKNKPNAKAQRRRWDFPSPYPMHFRVCRFMLDSGEFETVVTSLPTSFTLADIRELYHLRWGIETSFRDLKYTLGLVNLHGRSDAFAEQEVFANLTVFNFASRICKEVVVRQPSEGIYAYKVNYKMAVMLCREFIRTPSADAEELLENIGRYTVPIRPDRRDKRELRVKGFPGFVYRVAA